MIFSQVTKPKSHRNWTETVNAPIFQRSKACLHGSGGPQAGEVTRLGAVTRLSI